MISNDFFFSIWAGFILHCLVVVMFETLTAGGRGRETQPCLVEERSRKTELKGVK